jgi:hypothetical protein
MGDRSLSLLLVGLIHQLAMNLCLLGYMLESVCNKTVNKAANGAADFAWRRRLTVFYKLLIARLLFNRSIRLAV